MPFNIHNPFTVQDADDVNDNLYWIAQGSRMPYSVSAAGTLTSVDSSVGLGDSDTTWNTLYTGDVYSDSLTTADRSLFHYIGGETLSDTATSIEFTGLNGDDFESMIIIVRMIGVTNSVEACRMVINGDSGTNYGYQVLGGYSTTVISARDQTITSMLICSSSNDPTETGSGFGKAVLYSKTGNERTLQVMYNVAKSDTHVNDIYLASRIWNNTASTITSVKFYNDGGGGMFLTDTTIHLWGRK